ncbi:MAG: tRNA pseudouridine(55) synthase TruB [Actinomycetota bacterium]
MRPGFLIVDKPEGITSHDLIARARKTLGTRKIGHAGTLDPMATGVMVLGVESATRLLDYVMAGRKRYLATIKVGVLTVTDDRTGEVLESHPVDAEVMKRVERELHEMIGVIEQVPSRVSAIKVDGKRSYDRVRDGEEVELKARRVEIFSLDLVRQSEDEIEIDVTCSPGTYIRAIARDIGGHLTALRRIESQPFSIDDCKEIEASHVISAADAITRVMASYKVDSADQREISLGRSIELDSTRIVRKSGVREDVIAAVGTLGDLIALLKPSDGRLQPIVVLPESRIENQEVK